MRDGRTRSENSGRSGFIQKIIVLRGNDSTTYDQYIWSAHFTQFRRKLGDQGFVAGSQGTDAHNVNVRIYRLLGHFGRCLQRKSTTIRQ